MLAERIATIAAEMPPEIRRWFLEQDYAKPSVEDQDWDLILSQWNYVPLLIEYTEDRTNLLVPSTSYAPPLLSGAGALRGQKD